MQPEERDLAYLWDMLDAGKAVMEFIADQTYHDYASDRKLRNAIERNIEIIGEAANKVSKSFQKNNPQIPWGKIIAQRNVIAHEYGEIEDELLWRVAKQHVPELVSQMARLLPSK